MTQDSGHESKPQPTLSRVQKLAEEGAAMPGEPLTYSYDDAAVHLPYRTMLVTKDAYDALRAYCEGMQEDRLRARLAAHRAGFDGGDLEEIIDELRLRAETAERLAKEAARDAERYRWLRDRPSFIGWDWWNPPVPKDTWIDADFMDKAIDAQLEGTK